MINPTGSIFSQKRHNLDASTTGAEYTLGNRHQSRCDCLLPIQPEQELPGMTSTEKWMHPTRAEPPAQRNLRCDATNSLENCPEKRLGSSIRYMALNFSTIDINIFSTNTPSNGSTFPFQSHAAACPTDRLGDSLYKASNSNHCSQTFRRTQSAHPNRQPVPAKTPLEPNEDTLTSKAFYYRP